MERGARSPEELESLLEDAFVLRDREAVVPLFEDGAVLVSGGDVREARGGEEVAHSASELWAADRVYVAELRRVLQARDIALVFGRQGVSVVRRGADRAWRYAISVLSFDNPTSEEER